MPDIKTIDILVRCTVSDNKVSPVCKIIGIVPIFDMWNINKLENTNAIYLSGKNVIALQTMVDENLPS
jgi:hypothetical protein